MSQSRVDILTPTTGTKNSELRCCGLFSAWFHIRNRFARFWPPYYFTNPSLRFYPN
jgi:hypothetical protein